MRKYALLLAIPLSAQTPAPVQELLKTYCITCHSTKLKTAKLDLESVADEQEIWDKAARRMRNNEMPPKGLPQPKPEAKAEALKWFDLRVAELDRSRKPDPGRVTARRLNRSEYNNTMRDLFYGIDLKPANDFPMDDSGYGFDNIGDVLTVSPVLMERYLTAADRVVRGALFPEPPKRPILERYLPDKGYVPENSEVMLLSDSLAAKHRFPVDAEYELRMNVRLKKEATTHVHKIAFLLDGKLISNEDVPAKDAKRVFDFRLAVSSGSHEVTGAFLPTGDGEASELTIDNLEIRGPYNGKPPAPTQAYTKVFVCTAQTADCARTVLGTFMRRAWRRPVTKPEVERIAAIYDASRRAGLSYQDGMVMAFKAILVSPYFLFRVEKQLTGIELASRLSYFLWSTMPDEELLSLAEKGDLTKQGALEAQVKRMLSDPKAHALAENFSGQWLELRNMATVRPDSKAFPNFDRSLREAMVKESVMFFEAVMREDRSILDFIDGKFTFVNERLAKHYGIPGVKGTSFRRVELDGVERAGVLSQGAVLTVTSLPTRTSPVIRGLWVLENLLGTPPPPPPANIPPFKDEEVGKSVSMRDQFERHRKDAGCSVCHNRLDPLGFGLENYNGIGEWRTKEGNFALDVRGTLPDGRTFNQPSELRRVLREDSGAFTKTLVEKIMTYALGRGVESSDGPMVRSICRDVAANDHKFSSIVVGIVRSPAFQTRRGS